MRGHADVVQVRAGTFSGESPSNFAFSHVFHKATAWVRGAVLACVTGRSAENIGGPGDYGFSCTRATLFGRVSS